MKISCKNEGANCHCMIGIVKNWYTEKKLCAKIPCFIWWKWRCKLL